MYDDLEHFEWECGMKRSQRKATASLKLISCKCMTKSMTLPPLIAGVQFMNSWPFTQISPWLNRNYPHNLAKDAKLCLFSFQVV